MDILKILSRSTRQTQNSSSGRDQIPNKLPSAGTSATPQLFNDAIPESRGKKRKRLSPDKIEGQTEEQEEEVLDYFGPKSSAPKTKKTSLANNAKGQSSRPASASPTTSKLLDDEECRQVLRSHRLKVALLSSARLLDKEAKKTSKKLKSKKVVERKKSAIKQLYPQPLVAFDDLRITYGISKRLGENLVQQGYKIPTEVQMGSLPLLLQPQVALGASAAELGSADEVSAVDLLAVAPTGSGKTLAFLIPVVNNIIQRRRISTQKRGHVLETIIVVPTKELASQIVNEAKKLTIGMGIKVVGMRKGVKVVAREELHDQNEGLSEDEDSSEEEDGGVTTKTNASQPLAKADILVTTPLVLLHSISAASMEKPAPFPTVRSLVLDEADVLLDPLFREQTLGIWSSCTNPELRVTLWSATMGSNIEALASQTIHSRRTELGLATKSSIIRLVVGLKDSAIPNITHRLTYAATEPGKLIALRQLLHPTAMSSSTNESLRPPFLVFTQTIPRAVALHSELLYDIPIEAGGSSRIAVLHSDLTDASRDHIMTRFRNGEIWVLITTDILSRGVDFKGINGVVNYDVPNSGAAYIHRVGRTGRAGRDGGVAVTLYTKDDIPYVKNIANIIAASEKQAGKPPSEASMQKWFLDALPKPSKEDKKKLKMYGVETRRGGLGKGKEGKEAKRAKGRMQISTKSGYERKLENNRKGAIQGSRRRMREDGNKEVGAQDGMEDNEWAGIDE